MELTSQGFVVDFISFLGGKKMGRALLLLFLGVPIPIIILLALVWH